tara:strand:+ start:229 stop:372 length:144 start_codon:yes stop_codon:yes gene_type:complete
MSAEKKSFSPSGEMTEQNLPAVCRIFWPNHEWESQKRKGNRAFSIAL